MIHWKVSAFSFALGALTTVGFVWLRRSRGSAGRQLRGSVGPEPQRSSPEPRGDVVSFDANEAARVDALHDVGLSASEIYFDDPPELESTDTESTEMRSFDQEMLDRATGGERYDAVDAEEVGAEFLQRATEASVDSTGSHVGWPTEATAEPPDEPADIAAELPVGTTDEAGNTELYQPTRPSGPPAELSPTDEELERRRLAREDQAGPDKPHE